VRQREVRRASVKSARQRAENRASAILSLARIGACQRGKRAGAVRRHASAVFAPARAGGALARISRWRDPIRAGAT